MLVSNDDDMIKKAVLLCGGLATRLLPITKSIPKEMLPLIPRPAIDYCIQDLKENGITEYTDIALTFRVYDYDDWMADDIANESRECTQIQCEVRIDLEQGLGCELTGH